MSASNRFPSRAAALERRQHFAAGRCDSQHRAPPTQLPARLEEAFQSSLRGAVRSKRRGTELGRVPAALSVYWRHPPHSVWENPMDEPRRALIHASLIRPLLLGGAERELVLVNGTIIAALIFGVGFRSEERRVGKECRSRWSPYH